MKQAVSVIIFSEDRKEILLIKRRDIPVWVLPGGGLEEGEPPEKGAAREAQEETGYQVAIQRKVAEYLPVNRMTQLTHFFECSIVSGSPSTGDETREVRFFSLHQLPKLLPPPYKGWIADAASRKPEMIKKKIDGVSYWILIKNLILHPLLIGRFLLTKIGIHINY